MKVQDLTCQTTGRYIRPLASKEPPASIVTSICLHQHRLQDFTYSSRNIKIRNLFKLELSYTIIIAQYV